jgi:hypothetical protein
MTEEDDRQWNSPGLIAQAIWDYWNFGSTKRLISVLRSKSPLTSADRQLLADFIEAELKGAREDSKPTLKYLMQPDKSLAKRTPAADVEQIIKNSAPKRARPPEMRRQQW